MVYIGMYTPPREAYTRVYTTVLSSIALLRCYLKNHFFLGFPRSPESSLPRSRKRASLLDSLPAAISTWLLAAGRLTGLPATRWVWRAGKESKRREPASASVDGRRAFCARARAQKEVVF